MEKARFVILEAELAKQKDELDKIYARIARRARRLNSDEAVESLAYQLHNLYCAYEDLFKLVAEAFENNIEEGGIWHKEMLRRMSLAIKGIRPALISQDANALLSELRAFRHFFRHAYSYALDSEKVRVVLDKALRLKLIFEKDLKKFISAAKKPA